MAPPGGVFNVYLVEPAPPTGRTSRVGKQCFRSCVEPFNMVCDIIRTELHTFKYEVFLLAPFGSLIHCGTSVCVQILSRLLFLPPVDGPSGVLSEPLNGAQWGWANIYKIIISIVGFWVLIEQRMFDISMCLSSECTVQTVCVCVDICLCTAVARSPCSEADLKSLWPSDSLSNGRSSCWVHTFPDLEPQLWWNWSWNTSVVWQEERKRTSELRNTAAALLPLSLSLVTPNVHFI